MFNILGLPRSRTAWLSFAFTTKETTCYHEALSSHRVSDREFLVNEGSCDTNPLLYTFSDAPLVIVKRDIEEIKDSLMINFITPEGITEEEYILCIDNYIDMYSMALERIEMSVACKVIQVEELNSLQTLCDIWKYLLPEVPVDVVHLTMMLQYNIQTTNTDLTESLLDTAKTYGKSLEEFKEGIL